MRDDFAPTNTSVIGLQFGDEGKGQVVDRLTETTTSSSGSTEARTQATRSGSARAVRAPPIPSGTSAREALPHWLWLRR